MCSTFLPKMLIIYLSAFYTHIHTHRAREGEIFPKFISALWPYRPCLSYDLNPWPSGHAQFHELGRGLHGKYNLPFRSLHNRAKKNEISIFVPVHVARIPYGHNCKVLIPHILQVLQTKTGNNCLVVSKQKCKS